MSEQNQSMVSEIAALTARRSEPKKVDLPGTDKRLCLWNPAKGEYEFHQLDPRPRRHTVLDVRSLVIAAHQYAPQGAVWIEPEQITIVCDDDAAQFREHRVTLQLFPTYQFNVATQIKDMSPQQIDKLLERLGPEVVGDQLRKLFKDFRFKTAAEMVGQTSGGREAMSRSAVREAAFQGVEPPSEFLMRVFVYQQFSDICVGPADQGFMPETFAQKLRMMIQMDFENFTISFVPMEGEIARAVLATQALIRNFLRQELPEQCRVFIGQPSRKADE